MPSAEERIAVLEEQNRQSAEKDRVLFDKMDRIVTEFTKLADAFKEIKDEHVTCIRIRTETKGWFTERATKLLDFALPTVLAFLIILLLKNSGTILKTMDDTKKGNLSTQGVAK